MVDRPVLTPPEHAGHARELVREYDIFSIDGIVISSGDGLLYEVSVGSSGDGLLYEVSVGSSGDGLLYEVSVGVLHCVACVLLWWYGCNTHCLCKCVCVCVRVVLCVRRW